MDTSFGQAEKKLRLSRNIEPKEMAGDMISYQQILKFEKGQTMISAEKLIYLLEFLNISLDEYEHARHAIYGDSEIFYNQRIERALHHKDKAKLRVLLKETKEYMEVFPHNFHYFINMIEIKVALLKLNVRLKIPQKEIIKLSRHLLMIKEWTISDILIFSNCMEIFNESQLKELVSRMLYPESRYLFSPQTQSKMNLSLLKVINIFIKRKDYSQICELFSYLDEHIQSDLSTSERALLAYNKNLFDYCQAPSIKQLMKLKQFVSTFELLGCYDIANVIAEEINHYQVNFLS